MIETTGSVPSRGSHRDEFGRYVVRTFRHTLRGYSTTEVDAHLRQVRGWFTLAGFDQLLEEHRGVILASALREAEATVEHARREAQATIEQARHESAAIIEKARRESEAIREEATRRAEATTAAAEQRVGSLKSLARAILEETDAQP